MSNGNSEGLAGGKSLIRSVSILAGGTLLSRVLGFIRDVVLAKYFGTGWRADAFFVALRIPNLFRDLVGEGAANSAVVPVLSEAKVKDDPKDFWRSVNVIAIWALIILSAIVIVGMIAAPALVKLIAPGFSADPAKMQLTVQLTRLMFPYLILIGLTAHSMAVLYTFGSFKSPAFSPCLFNISIIISAFLSVKFLSEPTIGLAQGVLVGGILQLGVQIPPMVKNGFRFEKPSSLTHPAAQKCGKLLLPRLFGSGVYQLSVFIDTFCASLSAIVGLGGISAIYYASRLIQLPIGVFGFAMATATLPALSAMAARNAMDEFKRTVIFAVENLFFVMVPISIIFMLLSDQIIRVLFQRGAFDAYSSGITTSALLFYSAGLFTYSATKILITAFYALQDTKTPVKIAVVTLGINAALNFILMRPMKVGGIALASVIASVIGFSCLFVLLKKRIGALDNAWPLFAMKVVSAAFGAGAAIVLLDKMITGKVMPLVGLVILGGFGSIIYLVLCNFLKIEQAGQIWTKIFRTK